MDQVQPPPPAQPPVIAKSGSISFKKITLLSLVILLLIIVVVISVYLFVKYQNSNKSAQTTKTDTANNPYQALTSITGNIEQINGNNITLTQSKYVFSSEPITDTNPPKPPQEIKTTYTITVTPDTIILLDPPFMPADLIPSTPSAIPKGAIENLEVGQTITVTSNEDLNNNLSENFEAITINIKPGATNFIGTIKNVTSDTITVTATPPSVPEIKDYPVSIDKNTKITNSNLKQLQLSDLKEAAQVDVYTNSDINLTQIPKALRIIVKNL